MQKHDGGMELFGSDSNNGPSYVTEELEIKAPMPIIASTQSKEVILRATPILTEESSVVRSISTIEHADVNSLDLKSQSQPLPDSQYKIEVEAQPQVDIVSMNEKETGQRPKRKAALKAIEARKAVKKRRQKLTTVKTEVQSTTETLPKDLGKENSDPTSKDDAIDALHNNDSSNTSKDGYDDDAVSTDSSDGDDETKFRRCVVCLRKQRFTEDIFDSSKTIYYHIDLLIAHLNIHVIRN